MRPRGYGAAGTLLLVLLVWLVVYPLVLVLVEAFRGTQGWTLDHFRQFLARPTE